MTETERSIIEILEEDSRADTAKIAAMAGIGEEEAARLVRGLEQRGVIVKYTTIVDFEEDENSVEALIEVSVTPQTDVGFDGIAEEIAGHEEVKNLYLMSGSYDFLVIVGARSVRSVARFISECISTFACVTATATHFILKKYKIEGAVTRKSEHRRISVQP